MLESAFTSKLLAKLRKHQALREAIVWKHSDRWNAGIPDFSISIGTRTLWFEVKIAPNKLTPLQQHYLARLGVGGLLIVATYDGKTAMLHPIKSLDALTFEQLVEEIVIRCVNP